jgi:hypothetical protein
MGCAYEGEEEMSGLNGMPGLVPWHMWGTSQVVPVEIDTLLGGTATATQQLSKVDYKRPDSWGLFFSAQIMSGPIPAGFPVTVIVAFDLFIGVGRSMQEIRGARSFQWDVLPGATPSAELLRYSDSLVSGSGVASDPPLNRIIAQDIQCTARVTGRTAGAPGASYNVRVASFFAPLAHVRPDWYADAPASSQFRGAETGGK